MPQELSKTCVYITVDTECSLGGALNDPGLKPVGADKRVYGRLDGQEYGIGLMMDIAERHGLRLVFFVETLCARYFGEAEVARVCADIAARGHDVQLHLHPTWGNFDANGPLGTSLPDNMSGYGLDEQARMLRQGREFLSGLGLPAPTAFRAGNYGADRTTLQALAAEGFTADSSYNSSYVRGDWGQVPDSLNDAAVLDGVLELPVTNYLERLPLLGQRFKTLDLNGASFEEFRWALRHCVLQRFAAVTVILHSFSFLDPADVQYSRCGVRHYVIRRFEKLCKLLADMGDSLDVRTFADPLPHASPGHGESAFAVAPVVSALKRIAEHRIRG